MTRSIRRSYRDPEAGFNDLIHVAGDDGKIHYAHIKCHYPLTKHDPVKRSYINIQNEWMKESNKADQLWAKDLIKVTTQLQVGQNSLTQAITRGHVYHGFAV